MLTGAGAADPGGLAHSEFPATFKGTDRPLAYMRDKDPFRDIENLFDRMSREFEGFGRQFESSVAGGIDVDLVDRGEKLQVVADLPGFSKESIGVSIAGDELTISADYDDTDEFDEGRFHRRERRRRSVSRRVSLPVAVVEDQANATYNNGVLTVTLPKATAEDASGHHIDIE